MEIRCFSLLLLVCFASCDTRSGRSDGTEESELFFIRTEASADTVPLSNPDHSSLSLYERILTKNHSIIDEERRFDPKLWNKSADLARLGIDAEGIERDVYFRVSDEEFASAANHDSIEYMMYYRRAYGDQVDKLLIEEVNGKEERILLARAGGDGQFTYSSETSFINDSMFYRTKRDRETIMDEQTEVRYRITTITDRYKIHELLSDARLVSSDTSQFVEGVLSPARGDKKSIIVHRSKPFMINGQRCVWERTIEQFIDVSFTAVPFHRDKLIRLTDEEVLLETIQEPHRNGAEHPSLTNFKDINLDGHLDYSYYSATYSGSSGAFFQTHIYDEDKKLFELDPEFSGGELFVDSVRRIVSSSWKMGVCLSGRTIRYVDGTGNIKYRETTRRECIPQDDERYLLTRKKIIGTDTILLARDTVGGDVY